jgi:uncharacterized protein (DUF2342 family)
MDVKINHADTAMQNAGKLIQQVAQCKAAFIVPAARAQVFVCAAASKKQNKANIRKILTAIQQTMGVLSGAAEYDMRAKVIAHISMGAVAHYTRT